MYCLTFSSIEMAVKSADNKYDSSIIGTYVIMGLDRAKDMEHVAQTKSVHLRIYNTLLNTMCDTYLPACWREECYDYLEKMMPLLSVIYSYTEFKKQRNELTLLAEYFCHNSINIQTTKFHYSFETKNS